MLPIGYGAGSMARARALFICGISVRLSAVAYTGGTTIDILLIGVTHLLAG